MGCILPKILTNILIDGHYVSNITDNSVEILARNKRNIIKTYEFGWEIKEYCKDYFNKIKNTKSYLMVWVYGNTIYCISHINEVEGVVKSRFVESKYGCYVLEDYE